MASTMASLTSAAPRRGRRRRAAPDRRDLVAEAGPLEVGGVGVDHRVAEQVAGEVDAVPALTDAHVDVAVDGHLGAAPGRGLAGPHVLDRPADVRRGQVVEETPSATSPARDSIFVEGADDHRATLAEPHFEAEPAAPVEVAVEAHRVAGEALLEEGHVLADLGERSIRVGHAVPAGGDDGEEMPMPSTISASGCSACRVAPAMATTIGVRSCRARTPVPSPMPGAAAPAAARVLNASGPVVSAVQKLP